MMIRKPTLRIGIIGGGPWGTAVLDRLLSQARKDATQRFEVMLFDPAPPGPGIHDPNQPAHLLLNTVTGQVDSFSARHFGDPVLPGALTFLEWARKMHDPETAENGFLSRRQFGQYMRYVYKTLKANQPDNLTLVEHSSIVIDIVPGTAGRFLLGDMDGRQHVVDHIFVCTGHGQESQKQKSLGRDGVLAAYPCASLGSAISPDCIVGVQGMGLTAVDVVATLTVGRGGIFVEDAETGGLTYRPSGREPVIYCFSRSGTPFSCRPAEQLDLSGEYEPLYCHANALPTDRSLDFVQDVLPLVTAEMWAAFLLRHIILSDGKDAAAQMRLHLSKCKPEAVERVVRTEIGEECSRFDPNALLLGPTGDAGGARQEAERVLKRLRHDVTEATQGETQSPYKHAIEMLRVNRDFIRAAVDHGRLTPESQILFFTRIAPAIAQLIVGPPLSRGREWLALAHAGVLRFELCRSPEITRDSWNGHWTARTPGHVVQFDFLVHARLGDNWVTAPLIKSITSSGLCSRIRMRGLSYLRIDERARPVDATGLPVNGISFLGVPTEGSTYFNHYLPSPRSRARVYEQIDKAIAEMRQKAVSQMGSAA